MRTPPPIGIVVLNYRNHADTVECVRSLERVDYPDFRIFIVDNDSQNGSEEALREACAAHRVIQSGANLGYARGNNVGIRAALEAGSEWVVVLNNDTIVPPDFLTEIARYGELDESAGVLGALIVHEDGEVDRMSARRIPPLAEIFWNRGLGKRLGSSRALERRAYYAGPEEFEAPTTVDIVSGSCMALRREFLEEIGLLDEETFLFWEEFILASKVCASRFRTVLLPQLRVVHKGGRSVSSIGDLAARSYLNSLDHYLKGYRRCGWLTRRLVCAGPALLFWVGRLKRKLAGGGAAQG